MEDNIVSRLKLFMDTNGLSSSQFADKCGIPRPTLSQVLAGRNKKVSDSFVKQIHDAFPDLSIVWLMFGEGPVKVSGSTPGFGVSSPNLTDPVSIEGAVSQNISSVRIQNSMEPDSSPSSGKFSTEKALNQSDFSYNSAKNQLFEADLRMLDLKNQIENMRQNPRKVIQITIYYDDSTFETFIPKS